jgi:RNA polymerase sigma-70 factor (ECF subfamily)
MKTSEDYVMDEEPPGLPTPEEPDDVESPDRLSWIRRVENLHDHLLRDLTERLGRHDAQDVLQEFYLRVLRYRPRLDEGASVRSFINRVIRSVVADHYRARAAQGKVEHLIEALWQIPEADDPVDAVACDCLRALIADLPSQYAMLIERIDINEESRVSVAATLGISVANLAVRLTRARSALRKRLLAFCTSCPIHGFSDCRCPKSPAEGVAL